MKHIFKRLTALLLVFALVFVTAPTIFTAKAVDLSQPCSLTVNPGSSEYADDIEEANAVVDVYRVAEAIGCAHDSYTFNFVGAYSGIELSDNPDSNEWGKKSQEAAGIALDVDTPIVSGVPCKYKISNLSAGLYLIIVRGADLEDYRITVSDENGNERIATIAMSHSNTITFAPVLVSLPTKDADEHGVVNTANPGDWIYDSIISLKPEMRNRYGSLEIVKNLVGYVEGSPATFVFDIEAVLGGKNVYSNVVSLTFANVGNQNCRIDKIPVGAEVTVTEVYSGVCYRLVTQNNQTAVITADEIVSVEFTNEPIDNYNSGGGITNHFEYTSDGWTWTQIQHG